MRFFGVVGFAITEETTPGVWEDKVIEREYYGDANKIRSHWERSDTLNDDIRISTEISIIADPFAHEQFPYIKYVNYMGHKWSVSDIDISDAPRILLTLGGLYNG